MLKTPTICRKSYKKLGVALQPRPAALLDKKNSQSFKLFQCDLHKILNVATTRWLSVKNCEHRVLQQYTPLSEYLRLAVFEDPSKTTEELVATMDNEFTVIYLEFMSYTLGLLTQFNLLFQSEIPLLYKMIFRRKSVKNCV